MRIVDGDSHFLEPLDLWERYLDPPYRERALHFRKDSTSGEYQMLVDGKPTAMYGINELLADLAGYGQREEGRLWKEFDLARSFNPDLWDMSKRILFLDGEGAAAQVIYPSLCLIWEFAMTYDPGLLDAHCRAYNTWAFEIASGYKNRLYPAAHITLSDPQLAIRELQRVAALGCRAAFLASIPVNGKSLGHPDYDPVWAVAQDLDISICLHISLHAQYAGTQWYQHQLPPFMYTHMGVVQEPRYALHTMIVDGVFERFPRLRAATMEARVGWVGEWIDMLDQHFRYQGYTTQMKRPASEYFARNIWISGEPDEKMFAPVVQMLGDDKFFTGSDYPHGEGYKHPFERVRQELSGILPAASIDKIIGANAATFFGI